MKEKKIILNDWDLEQLTTFGRVASGSYVVCTTEHFRIIMDILKRGGR